MDRVLMTLVSLMAIYAIFTVLPFLLPILVVVFVVLYVYIRIKMRNINDQSQPYTSNEDEYQTYTNTSNVTGDVIDVDYTIVEEKENDLS